ncbi:MAG: menaquinone biosynthesis decarboxylase [Acidobacteria bacterium]|nr:menaquinone biosynthesis decarboxylase [Acidobacteriota bacterium]
MAYKDLREFVKRLEKEGELRRIAAPVDPELEITEITDRVSKKVGPALLFENVKGSRAPVLINTYGSPRRMAMALGVEKIEDVTARVSDLLDFKSPQGLVEKIKLLPRLADLAHFFPKRVRDGLCKEVIVRKDFSVLEFPILKCWPQDAGRYITMALVFTRDPETEKRNVGMYRMQVFDGQTTAMHWQTHKHGAEHFRRYEKLHRRMPVSVVIGAEPAVPFSAVLPLPEGLDELMLAGFLGGESVELVPCETNDLEVPASAEIVLEGYVDPGERRREGPFGDHTGFYSLSDFYPVFHITCITHRKDPLYQSIIVGRPPQEDCHMGKAIERIFLPVIQKQLPEIVDMNMPFEGVFHNLMIVSIRKSYPAHARKVMNALWGMGQAMFSKCIIVVDADTRVHDFSEVAWKVLNHIDPERDIQFTLGPVDVLDHASRLPAFGSKIGIDATRKWKEEGFAREWPDEIAMSPEIKALVDQKWPGLKLD